MYANAPGGPTVQDTTVLTPSLPYSNSISSTGTAAGDPVTVTASVDYQSHYGANGISIAAINGAIHFPVDPYEYGGGATAVLTDEYHITIDVPTPYTYTSAFTVSGTMEWDADYHLIQTTAFGDYLSTVSASSGILAPGYYELDAYFTIYAKEFGPSDGSIQISAYLALPEPSGWVLLGFGVVGLWLGGWRARRQRNNLG